MVNRSKNCFSMSTRNPVSTAFAATYKRFASQWRSLFQVAAWLFGTVATFVHTPFFLEEKWTAFARFSVAMMAGLLFLPVSRFNARKHTMAWVDAAAVLFALTMACFFVHDHVERTWSVPYGTTRALIGTTPTDFNINARKEFRLTAGRDPTDQELVWQDGGAQRLWPEGEVETRRECITAVYILSVVLPVSSIIAMIQALNCNAARRKTARQS